MLHRHGGAFVDKVLVPQQTRVSLRAGGDPRGLGVGEIKGDKAKHEVTSAKQAGTKGTKAKQVQGGTKAKQGGTKAKQVQAGTKGTKGTKGIKGTKAKK